MHVNEAPSPKPVVDTPPKSDLEKEVQKRKLRLLILATREWSKIESRMNNTEPKYLIGSVKAFVNRHEKLVIRIGEYEEAIHVPEIKAAKAWVYRRLRMWRNSGYPRFPLPTSPSQSGQIYPSGSPLQE
jgi:hypothetical protein